jgi:VWFA-related protein
VTRNSLLAEPPVSIALYFSWALAAALAQPGRMALAQSPQLIQRSQEERDQQYRLEHRIVLTVHVLDAAGHPVPNLVKSDFTVLDNQLPRPLASFHAGVGSEDTAMRILFVLDSVNSSTRQLQSFSDAIARYLRAQDSVLSHPASIGVLSGSTIDTGQPTRDRDVLLAELKARGRRLRGSGCGDSEQQAEAPRVPWLTGSGSVQANPPGGLQCVNERFISSVAALSALARQQSGEPGPAALLWFGPGWPTLTNREFRPDTDDLKRNFFDKLIEVTGLLREAQISLYALASPDSRPNPEIPNTHDAAFFSEVRQESQARAGNLGLHALAHITGGRILSGTRNLPDQIRTCSAEADWFYLLSFDAPPAAKYGEFHTLEVNADKPGLTVRTSTLYYAEQ